MDVFTKRHPLHTQHLLDWELQEAAYEGARALSEIGVISRHPREDQASFTARLRELASFNYSRSIVDLLNHYLFLKPGHREVPDSLRDWPQWRAFLDDADKLGNAFEPWLIEAQRMASIFGTAGVLVDSPSDPDRAAYPYVACFAAPSILDWEFVRGRNGERILDRLVLQEDSESVLAYRRDIWERYRRKDGVVQAVEAGENPLGVIPFVWLRNKPSIRAWPLGVSDLTDIAPLDANLLRILSLAMQILRNSAYPMLMTPKEYGGEGSVTVGPTAVLEYDPANPAARPMWLESAALPPVQAVLAMMERITKEIQRMANVGGLMSVESRAAKSGTALKAEFQMLNASLCAKASVLEEAERNIIYYWLAWQKREVLYNEIAVTRPRDFALEDLGENLKALLDARVIMGTSSPAFTGELQKRLAKTVLPDVSMQTLARIEDEIDAGALTSRATRDYLKAFNEETA